MTDNLSRADGLSALAQNVRDTLAVSRNCAQTSFSVLQQEFDLEDGAILKALTPFPGVALRGETCGAVTGCLMAIGLVHGRDRLDDWKGYLASLPPARRFCRRFEDAHGSTSCANLLEAKCGRKFNLADRGESLEYLAVGGPQACADIITSAVQIAAEIILETRPRTAVQRSPTQRRRRLQLAIQTFLAKAYVRVSRMHRSVRIRRR